MQSYQSKLLNQYSGKNVDNYEGVRNSSQRWASEIACFDSVLESVNPKFVIDCPIGTCRWADTYVNHGIKKLVGLDASLDMLEKSRNTIIERGIKEYSLEKVDLISGEGFKYFGNPDLVVCIRFLNWLCLSKVKSTMLNISNLQSQHMLVGVSVFDRNRGPFSNFISCIKLKTNNIKRYFSGLAPIYVHNKKLIEKEICESGWKIISINPIFEDEIRLNLFFLLQRKN